MKAKFWVAGFMLLALSGIARADDAGAVNSTVGKVQGMYVRLARGVLVQRAVLPARERQPGEVWVDVRLTGQAPDVRDWAIAQVTGDERIEMGDLVEVHVASGESRAPAPLARRAAPMEDRTHVTGLRAKYYTAEAMSFGARPAPVLRLPPAVALSER